MSKLKDKLQRKIKYFRVSMGQAGIEDKQSFTYATAVFVVFLWWVFLVVQKVL
jgi:hypothetical protein